MSVSLNVRMEQHASQQTDFDETSYLSFFQKSVEKIQVSLKWRRVHIYNSISLNSSSNEKSFRQNLLRKSKHAFSKIVPLWDNVEKYCGARGTINDVTIRRTRVECWISKGTRMHAHKHAPAPGHKHARAQQQTWNIFCFSTSKMIRYLASMLRYTYIVWFV